MFQFSKNEKNLQHFELKMRGSEAVASVMIRASKEELFILKEVKFRFEVKVITRMWFEKKIHQYSFVN